MLKWAVKVPFLHGTSAAWPTLRAGVGRTISSVDPNQRAVYTAIANSRTEPRIEAYARAAAQARGGAPHIARGKMDTQKGWMPRALTEQGKRSIGTLEDAHALVHELDAGAVEPRRGEIWKTLHQGTGSWVNQDPAASLRPARYTEVPADASAKALKVAFDQGVRTALEAYGITSHPPVRA